MIPIVAATWLIPLSKSEPTPTAAVASVFKPLARALTPFMIALDIKLAFIISPRLTVFFPVSSMLFPAAVISRPKTVHFLPVLFNSSSVRFNSVCWSAKATRDSLTLIVFFAIASSCFLTAFSAFACASFVSSSCAFNFLLSSLSLPVSLTLSLYAAVSSATFSFNFCSVACNSVSFCFCAVRFVC